VPDIAVNLISGEVLRSKGLYYRNDTQTLSIKRPNDKNESIGTVQSVNGLSPLVQAHNHALLAAAKQREANANANNTRVITPSKATARLWYQRSGHLSSEALKQAVQNTNGIIIEGDIALDACATCKLASSKKIHSKVPSKTPNEPYAEINVDVICPTVTGSDKSTYILLGTDSNTLYRHQYGYRNKGDGVKRLIAYILYIQRQTTRSVKQVRMDNELDTAQFRDFCEEQGIKIMPTITHNSTQNGRSEVSNHIVCTTARKLMIEGQLPPSLWPEAVVTAVYLLNLTPSRALDGLSPYHVLAQAQHKIHQTDRVLKPHVGNLKAYGCVANVYDHSIKRGDKFRSRAVEGKLVGYEPGAHNIYRVWIPLQHKVIRTTNVSFDESRFTLDNSDTR
jgi:hypothetical protein